MRRLSALALAALLACALALPALAHSFSGGGDCEGWTLHLDGLWGAHDVKVDGVSVGLVLTVQVPDTSDDEAREFTVRWIKQGPDFELTRTIHRQLDCEQETTTTTEVPPSSTVPSTSTTQPEDSTTTTSSTVPASSSTTAPPSTTTSSTPPESSSTTTPAPTTTSPSLPLTTPPVEVDDTWPVSETIPETLPDVLPYTGADTGVLVISAVSLLALGWLVVAASYKWRDRP